MLKGKELGAAIDKAIRLKLASGAVKTKTEIAAHFQIKAPSIYDWIKKGSISKDRLPELFNYFSDVVGPDHWGIAGNLEQLLTGSRPDVKLLIACYNNAPPDAQAAVLDMMARYAPINAPADLVGLRHTHQKTKAGY